MHPTTGSSILQHGEFGGDRTDHGIQISVYNYDGYTKRPEAAPDIGQHSRTNISLTYKTREHEEGLVELRKGDEVWYKLIDELTREDRPARIESENTRSFWIAERLKRRTQPQ